MGWNKHIKRRIFVLEASPPAVTGEGQQVYTAIVATGFVVVINGTAGHNVLCNGCAGHIPRSWPRIIATQWMTWQLPSADSPSKRTTHALHIELDPAS